MEYSILLGVALFLGNTSMTTASVGAEVEQIEQIEVRIELPVIEPVEDEKVEHEEPLVPSVACSCVKTAREVYGVQIPYNHNAWDLVANITEPEVGQLILMKYPTIGHVAVIDSITDEGYVISEGNYNTCQFSTRFIPKNYYAIIGFWSDSPASIESLAFLDI